MLILIFKYYNEELPNGNKWHVNLLDRSFIACGDRKQVFNIELQNTLEEYLKFRHFIRHAYGFQLEWTRMEYLINNIGTIWDKIKGDINSFILVVTG